MEHRLYQTIRGTLWGFFGTLASVGCPLYALLVPRKKKLRGVAAQLRTVARYMPKPTEIAKHLDKFADVLALPRFARHASTEPSTDLMIATELVEAIKVQLELMKLPRLHESELETSERERHSEIIDGIYALTPEWQAYKNIMQRRRVLLGNKPGSDADTRSLADGAERSIHEELAVRLSRDTTKRRGKQMLWDAERLASTIGRAVFHYKFPEWDGRAEGREPLENTLLDYVRQADDMTVAHQLVVLLVAALEERDGLIDTVTREDHPGLGPTFIHNGYVGMEQLVFTHQWPSFSKRDWSLLHAALKSSGDDLALFVEYLEDHSGGSAVIAKWCGWAENAGLGRMSMSYSMARAALNTGMGVELLEEIDDTGGLDVARVYGAFGYLWKIGACLRRSGFEGDYDPLTFDPTKYLYRRYLDRQRGYVPDGWEVFDPLGELDDD